MANELVTRLQPVRLRQRILFTGHCAAWGLLAGAIAAITIPLARLWGNELPWTFSLGLSAAGCVVGALVGWLWRRDWKQAARAVDARYQLKDRTETALEFQHCPKAGEMHALQIADAEEHLGHVVASEVAPWTMPRPLPYALAAVVAAVGLFLLPPGRNTAQASLADPIAGIVREAERLEQTMLPELEKLAEEQKEQKLEELVEELKELVEEMKEPGVDLRDALAKLSEMQAAVAEAQAEFNLEAVDASLKELGEALSPAAAMQAAADALAEGKYDKAAEALEQIDPSQITKKESRAAGEQLKKAAKKIADANQGELSDAAAQLAEGLENENESQCKGGLCKLAGLCKSQALRKSIGQCLGCQLAKLGECKSACQGACQGNKNGGSSVAQSDSPKQTWGLGASGQPLSDQATRIDANLNREDITGTAGDGPSEKEVSHAPEGREQASREYREKYSQYKRMNEAVLESEALPLGHRRTIRKYFESIRPQNEAAPTAAEE